MKSFLQTTLGLVCSVTLFPVSTLIGFLCCVAKMGFDVGYKDAKDLDASMTRHFDP